MPNLPSPPLNSSVIELDPKDPQRRTPFIMDKVWAIWLQDSFVPRVESGTQLWYAATLTNRSASIPVTPIPLGSVPAGLYRVSYYARVTQAATVFSSLSVAVQFTETTVSLSKASAAITGNLTTTILTDPPFLIRVDSGSSISYSTTYASVGGVPMKYRLDIVLELVSTP